MKKFNVIVTFCLDVEKVVEAESENSAIKKVKDWAIKNRKLRNKDFRRLESGGMEI